MSFPASRDTNFGANVEVKGAFLNMVQDAIAWNSGRVPFRSNTLARDMEGEGSIDYEPEFGAFVATTVSDGLLWTFDGLETWTSSVALPGTPGGTAPNFYRAKAGAGYVLLSHGTASGSASRLWRSTNGGGSWSAVTLPSDYGFSASTVRPAPWRVSYATWIMELDFSGHYARSTNGGVTWVSGGTLPTPSGGGFYSGIKQLARSPFSSTVVLTTGTSAVLVSLNDGQSFTEVILPGTGNAIASLGWTPRLGFFVAGTKSGAPCLYSSADGFVWTDAMGAINGKHGAAWGGFKYVTSCGHLLFGVLPQTSPSATKLFWSLAGVGAPWYPLVSLGLADPYQIPEVWPVFNGATHQRQMPFALHQTAPSSSNLGIFR